MRILIVEDDQKLARQLQKGLKEHAHSVTLAFDGHDGLHAAQLEPFDVFVLDVMLPGIDGFSLVRRLRADGSPTPILLLTARDTAEDIVMGLDAGADDYLTKPFSFKVLLARLRALARRKQVEPNTELHIADLVLDPAAHEVKRAGVPILLTPREFEFLELLLRSSGRVLTRSRLIEAVWGNERDVENNTVDVFIRQLRAKIEPPGNSKLIHTIRGVGYTLREEEAI
ncbi:MAG: response regulator transcription factor [Bryobacteraceae bacterium]